MPSGWPEPPSWASRRPQVLPGREPACDGPPGWALGWARVPMALPPPHGPGCRGCAVAGMLALGQEVHSACIAVNEFCTPAASSGDSRCLLRTGGCGFRFHFGEEPRRAGRFLRCWHPSKLQSLRNKEVCTQAARPASALIVKTSFSETGDRAKRGRHGLQLEGARSFGDFTCFPRRVAGRFRFCPLSSWSIFQDGPKNTQRARAGRVRRLTSDSLGET